MAPVEIGSRRGNYSFIMGGAIIALMGFAALAVDISLINMAELQAQSTADAASHAALVAYRNDTGTTVGAHQAAANRAAQFMIDKNDIAMGTATLDGIRFGSYDRFLDTFTPGVSPAGTINAVEVDISRESGNAIDLLLAPIFGVTTHDVDAHSITAQQERAIMMVQDWSCSMNNGEFPRPIDISRRATWGFLQYMATHPQDGDMYGITGYGRYGAAEDYTAATVASDPPWAELRLIETDRLYLEEQTRRICNTSLGCPVDPIAPIIAVATPAGPGAGPVRDTIGACTDPAIAMRQAIHQLSTRTTGSYFRGMIVFSDGVFNCTVTATGVPDDADDEATAAANNAYDNFDINIWTILYHAGSFDEDAMRDLTRGLGFYQGSTDITDLPAMYATVAESLPTAIVD